MTSKMFLDIVGVITTLKLSILSTFQGGGLREPHPMSSRVNKTVRIWKSHRTNFFSQYDEHNQKLSLDLKLEQDLKEKLRFSLSQVLFVTAVFLKNSKFRLQGGQAHECFNPSKTSIRILDKQPGQIGSMY